VACALRALTKRAHVPFVVNDRVDVALAAGADGVHLGQEDLPLAAARELAGTRLVIGVSTHTPAQAEAAARAGADYLGFGPVFATSTKANPDPVQGVAMLAEAVRRAAPVPVVAIGGIGLAQVEEIAASGAAAACVISGVNSAPDVVAAGRTVSAAFGRRS
jgi:thiamine-phosphate pyrophosphorylase